MELVDLAAHGRQPRARLTERSRLGDEAAVETESLVSAQNPGIRVVARDRQSLGLRQFKRKSSRIRRVMNGLDGVLVHIGDLDREDDAGLRQHRAPRCAF